MNLSDVLTEVWNRILEVTSLVVMPDWGALIGLLPILIVLGLIGPFLTFTVLVTMAYLATKPRAKMSFVEGPQVAEIGPDGVPVYPVGLPHCRRDGLIFASGTVRCDRCRDELAVVCPMCGLGRSALFDTCSNCGLVLRVKARPVPVRRAAGPRPGGAAAA